MFHKGFIVLRILGFLLLVGALIGGGAMLFHAGQSSGYAMGLANAGKAITAPVPGGPGAPGTPGMMPGYFYPGMYYRPHFFPFFAPFGLFGIGFFFLFLFLIGGFFRMFAFRRHMMWRHAEKEGMGPWGHHGMRHPWDRENPGEKPADPAKPQEPPINPPQA